MGGCLQASHAASTDQFFRINLHLIVAGTARPLLQNHACPIYNSITFIADEILGHAHSTYQSFYLLLIVYSVPLRFSDAQECLQIWMPNLRKVQCISKVREKDVCKMSPLPAHS